MAENAIIILPIAYICAMAESWESRRMRWLFKLFPTYWGTGATVTYISANFKELKVKIPLSWRTRNYVGTMYGGSMYAAIDPMYMLMLLRILGKDYVVWDKAATIQFRKPGTHALYADFVITDAELEAIKKSVSEKGELSHTFNLDIRDKGGVIYASVEKVIYIASKAHYKTKLGKKKARQ